MFNKNVTEAAAVFGKNVTGAVADGELDPDAVERDREHKFGDVTSENEV